MLLVLAKQHLQQVGPVPSSTRSNNLTAEGSLTNRPLLVLLLSAKDNTMN